MNSLWINNKLMNCFIDYILSINYTISIHVLSFTFSLWIGLIVVGRPEFRPIGYDCL